MGAVSLGDQAALVATVMAFVEAPMAVVVEGLVDVGGVEAGYSLMLGCKNGKFASAGPIIDANYGPKAVQWVGLMLPWLLRWP